MKNWRNSHSLYIYILNYYYYYYLHFVDEEFRTVQMTTEASVSLRVLMCHHQQPTINTDIYCECSALKWPLNLLPCNPVKAVGMKAAGRTTWWVASSVDCHAEASMLNDQFSTLLLMCFLSEREECLRWPGIGLWSLSSSPVTTVLRHSSSHLLVLQFPQS